MPTIMKKDVSQPFFDLGQKTLWDWLSLLIVPLLLFWVSHQLNKTQQQVADDQRQQALLRGYFEQISTLLIDSDLKGAGEYSEVKSVAASLTASTLRDLDSSRRNSLMRFLTSTGLAAPLPGSTSEAGILSRADLSGVDLSHTALNGIDLHSADLTSANLTQTDLGGGANLKNIRFINTDLTGADFENAALEGAVFAYTDLRNAQNLTDEQFSQVKLCNTRLPDGSESDRDCHEMIEQLLCNVEPPQGTNPAAFDYPNCDRDDPDNVVDEYIQSSAIYSPEHPWNSYEVLSAAES
ncbi:MAG: pentapeptide repeat-containing protein [Elainellaceae cyanobacterium]